MISNADTDCGPDSDAETEEFEGNSGLRAIAAGVIHSWRGGGGGSPAFAFSIRRLFSSMVCGSASDARG